MPVAITIKLMFVQLLSVIYLFRVCQYLCKNKILQISITIYQTSNCSIPNCRLIKKIQDFLVKLLSKS